FTTKKYCTYSHHYKYWRFYSIIKTDSYRRNPNNSFWWLAPAIWYFFCRRWFCCFACLNCKHRNCCMSHVCSWNHWRKKRKTLLLSFCAVFTWWCKWFLFNGDLFNLFVTFEVMLLASYAFITLGGTNA